MEISFLYFYGKSFQNSFASFLIVLPLYFRRVLDHLKEYVKYNPEKGAETKCNEK